MSRGCATLPLGVRAEEGELLWGRFFAPFRSIQKLKLKKPVRMEKKMSDKAERPGRQT